ncbi:UNVERIFIED_ORG: polysaccharide pyruvyl transferase [Martelella mediterranea]
MSAKRIGIFTYHFSENFGALMQAYGTRQWLIEQGHQAEFVNYHPRYVEEGGDFSGIFKPAHFRSNLKILYLKLSRLKRKFLGNRQQAELFAAFHRDVLGVTGTRLETKEDVETFLSSREGRFDMLITGSDQIWNPSDQKGLDPVYFLAFGPTVKARRVTYAPSFGRATLDTAYNDDVRAYIGTVDGLSVREQSGVDILRSVTRREAACVPDPAILLGDFSTLVDRAEPVRTGHVFCYALRSGDGIREVTEEVSRTIGAPIVSPYNVHRRWREIGETVYPSPAGWVSLINSSEFSVTNSFHGTVLSILLQKPFLVVGLPGVKGGLNERAKDLLQKLELTDRFVEAGDVATARRRIGEPIDWAKTSENLQKMQKTGRDFLNAQLEK